MTEKNLPIKVVVIGGGYAGTVAANRLQQNTRLDITLVNPRPKFVHRLRLHQFTAGTGDATADYGTLLGDRVQLVVDDATRIDTADRQVRLASGRELDYDYIIYAVGSTGTTPASVPGATEFAYPIAELEQAAHVRAAIDNLHSAAPVTVVGAGLTGIETAAELAEQGRNVTLVCGGQLGPALSRRGRRSVAKTMAKLGINVLETEAVTEVRPDAVVFSDGAVRPSAITIWTAGFGVPELGANSGLHTDAMGRLLTDETLTSVDDARVVAAGDCAAPSGEPLRMCCASAVPLGAHAADTVLSRIARTEPAVIDVAITGSCISLGRRAATLQFARKNDTAIDFYLGGRLIASFKEAVNKGVLWGVRREGRNPGSTVWLKGDQRPAQPVSHPVASTP